jgi:hypothetical protein
MREEIAAGLLPADYYERYLDAVDANCFGVDAPKDPKTGRRRECGRGAPGFETFQHFQAMVGAERRGELAPGTYAREVASMWKRDPKRAAEIGLPKA